MKKILGLAVLAAMCLTGCGALGGKTDELTDINEVKKEYKKSPDEARKKYDGKELTVLGKVAYRSTVNPTIRVGTSSDPELSGVPDIECHYDQSDPLFKNVTDNQVIKVKGVLKITASGMEMKPCKFVPF
ncbi:MAG TPA: hypothetical protein VF717_15990 [Pyrinomonadaceae bacterium]|jgi:hypothetical protein